MMIITLPGIGGSGATHWQTLWEQQDSTIKRFQPQSWDEPDLDDWIAALERAVAAAPQPPVLVAHSLSCLLVAHWQAQTEQKIAGAFLVAVPDPSSQAFPRETDAFAPVPEGKFHFPSLILTSQNDPFGTVAYAARRAKHWGSGLITLGEIGHINGASKLGEWPEGRNLLTAFMAGLSSK